jgi:hypothetical protein
MVAIGSRWCAAACASMGVAFAMPAQASFVTTIDAVDVAALDLGDSGEWSQGEHWWQSGSTVVLNERWVGPRGASVVLDTHIQPLTRAPVNINFEKQLENTTGFGWTSFSLLLSAGAGASITNLQASANAEFGNVAIVDLGGGMFEILWSAGNGGVSVGGMTTLNFSFEIDGAISFSQVQTPIPAPGAALALAAGLGLAVRRRR